MEIVSICISYDDLYVIAAGLDGVITIFDLREKDGTPLLNSRIGYIPQSSELLISNHDLIEQFNVIRDMKGKVKE